MFTGDTASPGLTKLEDWATEATISPDGQQVAYVTTSFEDFEYRRDLALEPFAGGTPRVVRRINEVESSVSTQLYSPAFSPDGEKVAVGCRAIFNTRRARPKRPERAQRITQGASSTQSAERTDCLAGTEEVDPDTSTARGLIYETDYARYVDDGEGLLYHDNWDWPTSLAEMDLDGEQAHPLPNLPGVYEAREAIASPNGTQVAFSGRSEQFGIWHIYVLDLETQRARALTSSEGRRPTWTPDGQSVAYVNDSGAHLVSVATGAQTTLASNPVASGGDTYNEITSINFPQPRTFDNIAQRFRPNLYFDTSEPFRPLNVENLFREKDDLSDPLHQGCGNPGCLGLISSENLKAFPDEDDYLDIGQVDGEYASPNPECAGDDDRVDCDSGPATTAYYNTTENHSDGYSYADYWYFYRLNDFPNGASGDGGDHEGDWESITLAFAFGLQSSTFDFAQFSQHGYWYRYLRSTLECDGRTDDSCGNESSRTGQRLTVYVANGSHANYPQACSSSPSQIPLCPSVDPTDDGVGVPKNYGEAGYDGEHPWGENGRGSLTSLARFPTAGGWDPGPQNWTDWPGRWGRPGGETPEIGPESPGAQPHYSNPGDAWCVLEPGASCGTPNRNTATSRPVGQIADDPRCRPWLGGMVVAAVCDPETVQRAHRARQLGRPGAVKLEVKSRDGIRQDSAPGIAQAVGLPLRQGDKIRLSGQASESARFYVRVAQNHGLVDLGFRKPAIGTPLTIGRNAKGTPVLRTTSGNIVPATQTRTHVIR